MNVEQRFREVLSRLGPRDAAIDCGANVGAVTRRFRQRGCTVYAFEPDPIAAAEFRRKFADDEKVIFRQAAVGAAAGTAPLYFHPDRSPGGKMEMTQSSSLVADKRNVSTADYANVEVIDFGKFLGELERVAVLKIDIEGAEAEVLTMILDRGLYDRFDHAFVETHETKVPSTAPVMANVRAEIERLGLRHIHLDWR